MSSRKVRCREVIVTVCRADSGTCMSLRVAIHWVRLSLDEAHRDCPSWVWGAGVYECSDDVQQLWEKMLRNTLKEWPAQYSDSKRKLHFVCYISWLFVLSLHICNVKILKANWEREPWYTRGCVTENWLVSGGVCHYYSWVAGVNHSLNLLTPLDAPLPFLCFSWYYCLAWVHRSGVNCSVRLDRETAESRSGLLKRIMFVD